MASTSQTLTLRCVRGYPHIGSLVPGRRYNGSTAFSILCRVLSKSFNYQATCYDSRGATSPQKFSKLPAIIKSRSVIWASSNSALRRWKNSGSPWKTDDQEPSSPPVDKRPRKILPRLTTFVPHENIYTLPNILTFSRLLAAPAVGYFILTSQPAYALSLFFYAGVTDLVDGYIARTYHQQTVVGTVIDPMADKTLMTISVVALAVQGSIPVWLAGVILARDVGLAIAAVYYRWISLPPPKTMARYWDFSLPSAEVHPTAISKANTFLQLLLVGWAMAMPVVPAAIIEAWHLGQGFEAFKYLVAATTIWSGASYVYSKDAVKILTYDQIREKTSQAEKDKTKA